MNRRGAENAENAEREERRNKRVFFLFSLCFSASSAPLRLCGSIVLPKE